MQSQSHLPVKHQQLIRYTMAILVSKSIYIVYISIIFLGLRTASLLACPLPDMPTCGQCEVLRHINSLTNSQSKINLTVNLDLSKSINRPTQFAQDISSVKNPDYFFESNGTAGCSNNDTPCSQFIKMVPENSPLPICSWIYTCDYSPNRFPQYIWRANCTDTTTCQEVYYQIPTLTLHSEVEDDDCLPFQRADTVYTWGQEMVAVACTSKASQ